VVVEIAASTLQGQVLIHTGAVGVIGLLRRSGWWSVDFQGDIVLVVDIGPGTDLGYAIDERGQLLLDTPTEGVVLEGDGAAFYDHAAAILSDLVQLFQSVIQIPGQRPSLIRGAGDSSRRLVAGIVMVVAELPAVGHAVGVVVDVGRVLGAGAGLAIAYVVVAVTFVTFGCQSRSQTVDVVIGNV